MYSVPVEDPVADPRFASVERETTDEERAAVRSLIWSGGRFGGGASERDLRRVGYGRWRKERVAAKEGMWYLLNGECVRRCRGFQGYLGEVSRREAREKKVRNYVVRDVAEKEKEDEVTREIERLRALGPFKGRVSLLVYSFRHFDKLPIFPVAGGFRS